jgi:hypothetical protein
VCEWQVVSVKVASVNITRLPNLAQIGPWKQLLVWLISKLAHLLTQPMHCVGSAGKIRQLIIMSSKINMACARFGIFGDRRVP